MVFFLQHQTDKCICLMESSTYRCILPCCNTCAIARLIGAYHLLLASWLLCKNRRPSCHIKQLGEANKTAELSKFWETIEFLFFMQNYHPIGPDWIVIICQNIIKFGLCQLIRKKWASLIHCHLFVWAHLFTLKSEGGRTNIALVLMGQMNNIPQITLRKVMGGNSDVKYSPLSKMNKYLPGGFLFKLVSKCKLDAFDNSVLWKYLSRDAN